MNIPKTPRSFELLYRKHALPLMKFLIKKTGGNQFMAEEVFSSTFLAAWKGFHTFEQKSKFFTWLCRIALNKAADYYRDQIHYESHLIAPALIDIANIKDKNLTPEEKASLDEIRNCVHDCLNLLSDEKRNLLYLRYWKDMTIKGIAETFDISERSAEGKVYRAKLAFREVITKKYPNI
ncbi:MAG: sigma-70 family RNA polymerase sigma factor [Candidatus Daviesbacteria bacterium]|nr:sigma-70 family RNA polymerase sigma factor [Candidatus Daviesbacteria bacterium]